MSGLEAVARTSGGREGGAGIGGVNPGRGLLTGLLTYPLWHAPVRGRGTHRANQGSFRGSPTIATHPVFG